MIDIALVFAVLVLTIVLVLFVCVLVGASVFLSSVWKHVFKGGRDEND